MIWGTLGHLKREGVKMVSLIQLLGSIRLIMLSLDQSLGGTRYITLKKIILTGTAVI